MFFFFFFSSRRRHTRFSRDWSSDVCSSDLGDGLAPGFLPVVGSEDHHGEVGEVDHGADAETPRQLAGAYLPHPGRGHRAHPCPSGSSADLHPGSPESPLRSTLIRDTLGSTSRSEFSSVKGSQPCTSGDFNSDAASPPAPALLVAL